MKTLQLFHTVSRPDASVFDVIGAADNSYIFTIKYEHRDGNREASDTEDIEKTDAEVQDVFKKKVSGQETQPHQCRLDGL